jgi:hypothetical protein
MQLQSQQAATVVRMTTATNVLPRYLATCVLPRIDRSTGFYLATCVLPRIDRSTGF